MLHNMQLAIVAGIEQLSHPALIPAESLVSLQCEDRTCAHAADSDHLRETCSRVGPQRKTAHNSSQSGFSLIGWRAVSSVAVMRASGCRCNNVIGYSVTGSLNSATRKAVCFHEPVSL